MTSLLAAFASNTSSKPLPLLRQPAVCSKTGCAPLSWCASAAAQSSSSPGSFIHLIQQARFFGCQDAKTRKRNFERVRNEQKAKQQRLHQQEVDMARDEKKKEKATGKRASPKAGTSGAGAPGGGTGSKLHIVASTRKRVSTF
eukprot:CAMPEP_0179006678 /NCGR_PEP_ID=MMETSP0795-20121207/14699_1 /TAXON_ID=88552 /ORGANISM="Amoebophrya sp., Strain Ameob2" /LENGTH=142 /DNA_ID=CAMNT_0020701489 /DNA_START=42 /DNA_END=470 /DNA_ORIENTATION=+